MQELNPISKTTADDKNLLTCTHEERYGLKQGATLRKTSGGNNCDSYRAERRGGSRRTFEFLFFLESLDSFSIIFFYLDQRKDCHCINNRADILSHF